MAPFDTPLSRDDAAGTLDGPWRAPVNILQHQSYGGHASIHDDATARGFGFAAAPIEGPTHFSQLAPLGVALFGGGWLGSGCISAHYRQPVFEGERVRASAAIPPDGATVADVRLVKEDGSEVLQGTLSIGPGGSPTALDRRLATAPPLTDAEILAAVCVGWRGRRLRVRLDPDAPSGDLYPFSLADKLAVITEPSPLYAANAATGGRAIMPFEMISVLCQYRVAEDALPVPDAAIGLFADQEIRLLDGPLLVGEDYEIEREVVALSGSRRSESVWMRTRVFDARGAPAAEMLLNQAYLRGSVG